MFTTINVISRNETTQLYGAILPVALTNEDIRNSEILTKEIMLWIQEHSYLRQIGSKKKANTDAIPKLKPSPTAPQGKERLSQLKIVIKRSRQETHSSHASGSGADEGTGVKPGVPDAPDYDSEDDISWKSSMMEQDQEYDDAENHYLTTHDDEIMHEEDTDEGDSSISSSDEEDSDNDVEGANVASVNSDEDATDEKDQGNEAVKDTNTDLDGRDKVMTDVEDTHVTLTPVNPDGQQQSSSVSSGFVSNMLNPNQDTGVDDIFLTTY
ncbi:hypothetical protein Tco_0927703 [Tanacetum coccineum]